MSNPFLSFFLEALETSRDACEKQFLKDLLTHNTSYRESVRKSASLLIHETEERGVTGMLIPSSKLGGHKLIGRARGAAFRAEEPFTSVQALAPPHPSRLHAQVVPLRQQ